LALTRTLQDALQRAAEKDGLNVNRLSPEDHWRLMGVPANLGFLRNHPPNEGVAVGGDGDGAGGVVVGGDEAVGVVAQELLATTKLAEPARWEGKDEADLHKLLDPGVSEWARPTNESTSVPLIR